MTRARLAPLAALALLAACADLDPPGAPADLAPLSRPPAYAVVTSDFLSSAIALLDARGELVTEAWIDSGSRPPGLSTALSGDVVLPTAPVAPGTLAWIDRLAADTVTLVAVPSGELLAQVPVTPSSRPGETAFAANPHDAVGFGDALWVTRFERNLDGAAGAFDRGNDLLRVEPATGALAARIGLEAGDAVDAEGASIPARPDRAVALGDRIVVGLSRLALDFLTAAPGAVAVVTPDAAEVVVLPLPGLANCGEVAPVPGDATRAVVACWGPTFVGLDVQREGAGLAVISAPPGEPPVVERLYRAADHPADRAPTHGPVPVSATVALAVAAGNDVEGVPDALVRVDLTTGASAVVLESAHAFELGPGTASDDGRAVLVPDASAGVHVLDVRADAVTPRAVIDPSPVRRLPAREVRRLTAGEPPPAWR